MTWSNSDAAASSARRGLQPALPFLLALGAPTDEPAHQLLPARGLRGRRTARRAGSRAPGARPAGRSRAAPLPFAEGALHRAARGAVLGAAVHDGVLEELPRLGQPVELGVVDEVVVHAVDLTGPRRAASSSRPRTRPAGSASGRRRRWSPCRPRSGPRGRRDGTAVALGVRRRHARSKRRDERGDLVRPEAAHPPGLRDAHLVHDRRRAPVRHPASTPAARRPSSCR